MGTKINLRSSLSSLNKLDIAAITFASVLSLSCLARGAVYDVTIAVLLLISMPILFAAAHSARPVHPTLKITGIVLLAFLALILFLQQWVQPTESDADLWQQVQLLSKQTISPVYLHDKAAWLQGIGRLLFFIFAFVIALFIGSSESSARLFLQALLGSGVLCLAATFFVTTANGVPTSYYSYAHGFVNSNNAATYLGVMLLLVLAQAARILRRPHITIAKILPDFIDQLNLATVMHAFFLLFTILLVLACLFMTGSRGGILLSLLCGALFSILIILKTNLHSRTRKWIIVSGSITMGILLIWSFLNFGQTVTNILERDGFSHHTRLEMFTATIPMIGDYPLLGVGLGSFPAMFQQYRPEDIPSDGIIDKAHNSYLEFASEMGLPALFVLLAALSVMGYLLYGGFKGRKERYINPTLGLSVWALIALHSLIDFPLQIPGIAALCIAITTVCASETDPRFSEPANMENKNVRIKRIRIRKQRSKKA